MPFLFLKKSIPIAIGSSFLTAANLLLVRKMQRLHKRQIDMSGLRRIFEYTSTPLRRRVVPLANIEALLAPAAHEKSCDHFTDAMQEVVSGCFSFTHQCGTDVKAGSFMRRLAL